MTDSQCERLRLDQWLWAARFFKTRSISKASINGSKIKVNNKSCKPSKEVQVGDTILVKTKSFTKTIVVTKLSNQRRDANFASTLFKETDDSIENRFREAAIRKAASSTYNNPVKPNKKQRRQMDSFLSTRF